jgi:hypothetical protein
MTEEEKEDWMHLMSRMDQEGFDYCWRHYSNFKEIKDQKFHELRESYIKAANELEDYVKEKKK